MKRKIKNALFASTLAMGTGVGLFAPVSAMEVEKDATETSTLDAQSEFVETFNESKKKGETDWEEFTRFPEKKEDSTILEDFLKEDEPGVISYEVSFYDVESEKEVYFENQKMESDFREALEGIEYEDPFYALSKMMDLPEGYRYVPGHVKATVITFGDGKMAKHLQYGVVESDSDYESNHCTYIFKDKNGNVVKSQKLDYLPGMSSESDHHLLNEVCPSGKIHDYVISNISIDSDPATDDFIELQWKEKPGTPEQPETPEQKPEVPETEQKPGGTTDQQTPPQGETQKPSDTEKGTYTLTIEYVTEDGKAVGTQKVVYSEEGYNEETYVFLKGKNFKVEVPKGYVMVDETLIPDSITVSKGKTYTIQGVTVKQGSGKAGDNVKTSVTSGVGIATGGLFAGLVGAIAAYKKRKSNQ